MTASVKPAEYPFSPPVEWLGDGAPIEGSLVYTINLKRDNPVRVGLVYKGSREGQTYFYVVEWAILLHDRQGNLVLPEVRPLEKPPLSVDNNFYAQAVIPRTEASDFFARAAAVVMERSKFAERDRREGEQVFARLIKQIAGRK